MAMPAPWWIALALSAAIALVAWRLGSLRFNGAVAALLIGTAALRVQWAWGAFLLVWFVVASILTRMGRERKAHRTAGLVEKGGERDAWQVLANGGVFACCALWWLVNGSASVDARLALAAAAAASLSAAGADTWSTEIGTLLGGDPISLRTGRRTAAGTSGAVTWQGSLGGVAGAIVLTALAVVLGVVPAALAPAVAIGALAGALADTVTGAWWQEQRWCAVCGTETERAIHVCGAPSRHVGGVRGLNNDAVNAACTVVGAVVAGVLVTFGIGPT